MDEHPLRAWRLDHRLTLSAAAQQASASLMQWWRWESGASVPRPPQMEMLHRLTGLEPNAFYDFLPTPDGREKVA